MTRRQANPNALIGALAVSMAVLATPERAAASPYKITALGDIEATGLNDAGQIAGYFNPRDGRYTYGFFYDANSGGGLAFPGITLSTESQPGGYDFSGYAQSLNERGRGVGVNRETGQAMIFDARTGASTPLPIFKDYYRGNSFDITDSGAVYGTHVTKGASGWLDYRPFVYRDGAFQVLDAPPGMHGARLVAADDAGRILVAAHANPGGAWTEYHTFLFDNDRWTDLGSGNLNGFGGQAMNARGDVVGTLVTNRDDPWNTPVHAMLIPNGGEAVELGALPGHDMSTASAINDLGQIVGRSSNAATGEYSGFLYQNGVMTDLNDLVNVADGWLISDARLINGLGQIVAIGTRGDGERPSFLLLTPDGLPIPSDLAFPEMPVPEPSTWVVFALAAVGLGWRGARKRGRISRGR